ncbi:predicted protein [Aspergillus terreus NIH2624]|uniref:Nephrocystin 3-like N-terminal domain-containing protein n=1 Tax=Aspergillus terreus (strain NIH 2624 / FGSC A1156) TaxID=341663 RepID=Q0CZ48_ASPTN|nr:uncharacterized protein ATEG_01036 [Aspergillus terreus NIH2624]EAU37793.1 predicted protein [Aspergillus terreus NIH2624]
MDPLSIIELVSNIISFIDFGRKLLTDVREIQNSAAGVTQDALTHEFIAQQMREFTDKLIPPNQSVDDQYKGTISLAKECRAAAADIQKLLNKIKPKDPGSRLQSWGSGIKGLRYGKELSSLQAKMERYRDQLVVQLNWVTTSEVKDRLERLARDFDKNGDRIIQIQKQVGDLKRTVKTSDAQLRQAIRDLLGLSHGLYVTVHSHRLLENLRFDEMDSRFHIVPYAHERTFEWIFSCHEYSNDIYAKFFKDYEYHDTIREQFKSWLSFEDGIYHVSGKLGSGKSALMKFLYPDLRTKNMLEKWAGHERLIMAHFFFWRPGSNLQHSVRGLYRALLYKTLSVIPSLIPEVLPEQWKEIQSKPWQANAKVDFPLKTLQHAMYRLVCCQSEDLRICFFIDGLDECKDEECKGSDSDQHRHLAQTLSCWCAESKGRLKICASSREYNVFLENLPSERRLYMQRLTEEDMRIYIRDRMSFARGTEGWAELIKSMIKKADGIFLWVALVTSRLQYLHESKVSWNILQKEIDQAPEGLYNLFSHVIQSLASSDLRRAYRTFAIIRKLGEYRLPLPLLCYPFIDHYTGDSDFDSCEISHQERMSESDRLKQARGMLMGYCGGLFEPTQTNYRDLVTGATIAFTHRSVPEFVESLDTKEMEKHLRDFCAEDAASYLFLAYLWAKDIGNLPQGAAGQVWLSYITSDIITMRKVAKIGKAPFHFEEQMWSVLTRLGARTITDQDPYYDIIIPVDVDYGDYEQIACNSEHKAEDRVYHMSHPFYLSAWFENLGYVQWKLAHDPSVAPTPFHLVLLFYSLLYVHESEESAAFYQILDTLRERGLSPQTMTTLAPSARAVNSHEITVWQHFILWVILEGQSRGLCIWRWLLENGADPHFIMSVPNEEWPTGSSAPCTLVLGRERRRLDEIDLQHVFDGPVTSEKYPNPDGTGIRMTLVDIIREKHFAEGEEELIALVERNMRLFGDEPERTESTRGISEGDFDEEAGDTTPANKTEIALYTPHDQPLPGSEGKWMMLSAYILGGCPAGDDS